MNMKHHLVKSDITVWGVFTLLLILAGFRWDVGTDWPNYMDMFGRDDSILILINRIEPGNIALSRLLKVCGMYDAGYWLFAMACIILFCTFYTIRRYSDNRIFSIAIYLCMGMFFASLNVVRQYAAVAITTLAWPLIVERRFIRFVIVTLVATMFHMSALVILPLYFLCTKKLNAKWLMVMGIAALPLSLITGRLVGKIVAMFPVYGDLYAQDSMFLSVINPLSALRAIYPFTLLLFILNTYKKITSDERSLMLTNITLCYIFIVLLFPGVPLISRIGSYFEAVLILFIPLICRRAERSRSVLFKCYTICYGVCLVTATMLTRAGANLLPFEMNFRLAGWSLFIMVIILITVCAILIKFAVPKGRKPQKT